MCSIYVVVQMSAILRRGPVSCFLLTNFIDNDVNVINEEKDRTESFGSAVFISENSDIIFDAYCSFSSVGNDGSTTINI